MRLLNTFISIYAIMEAPLSSLIHGKGLSSRQKSSWMPEANEVLVNMKLTLQSSLTLGLPDP